jgi:hypothetical protein
MRSSTCLQALTLTLFCATAVHRADIRLIDAGRVSLEEMPKKEPRRFAQLRRCDLLIHVVRCFDAPPIVWDAEAAAAADADTAGDNSTAAAFVPKIKPITSVPLQSSSTAAAAAAVISSSANSSSSSNSTAELLPSTPIADILQVRAAMAYADLHIIDERHKMNTTKTFWRVKARAINEIVALGKLEPALVRLYLKVSTCRPLSLH